MNLHNLLYPLIGLFHSIESSTKKQLIKNVDIPTLVILESIVFMILGVIIGFTQISPRKFLRNIKNLERKNYFILILGTLFIILYLFIRYFLMRNTNLGIYVLYEEVSITLMSLLFGYLVFNETITKTQGFGIFLVITGIYFINI